MKNQVSINRLQKVWRNGLILQFTLLAVLIFVPALDSLNKSMHLAIYFSVIGVFICMLILPVIVAVSIKRSVIIALLILVLFNGLGSLILYLMYKNDLLDAVEGLGATSV